MAEYATLDECAAMLRRFGEAMRERYGVWCGSDNGLSDALDAALTTLPQEREPQRQERCAGFYCVVLGGEPSLPDEIADCEANHHRCHSCGRPYSECLASRTQASQSAAAEAHEHCEHGRAKAQCLRCSPVAAPPAPGTRPSKPPTLEWGEGLTIREVWDSRAAWIAYARAQAERADRLEAENERLRKVADQACAENVGRQREFNRAEAAEAKARGECVAALEGEHARTHDFNQRLALVDAIARIRSLGPVIEQEKKS